MNNGTPVTNIISSLTISISVSLLDGMPKNAIKISKGKADRPLLLLWACLLSDKTTTENIYGFGKTTLESYQDCKTTAPRVLTNIIFLWRFQKKYFSELPQSLSEKIKDKIYWIIIVLLWLIKKPWLNYNLCQTNCLFKSKNIYKKWR